MEEQVSVNGAGIVREVSDIVNKGSALKVVKVAGSDCILNNLNGNVITQEMQRISDWKLHQSEVEEMFTTSSFKESQIKVLSKYQTLESLIENQIKGINVKMSSVLEMLSNEKSPNYTYEVIVTGVSNCFNASDGTILYGLNVNTPFGTRQVAEYEVTARPNRLDSYHIRDNALTGNISDIIINIRDGKVDVEQYRELRLFLSNYLIMDSMSIIDAIGKVNMTAESGQDLTDAMAVKEAQKRGITIDRAGEKDSISGTTTIKAQLNKDYILEKFTPVKDSMRGVYVEIEAMIDDLNKVGLLYNIWLTKDYIIIRETSGRVNSFISKLRALLVMTGDEALETALEKINKNGKK